jgi:hypothetical protein
LWVMTKTFRKGCRTLTHFQLRFLFDEKIRRRGCSLNSVFLFTRMICLMLRSAQFDYKRRHGTRPHPTCPAHTWAECTHGSNPPGEMQILLCFDCMHPHRSLCMMCRW